MFIPFKSKLRRWWENHFPICTQCVVTPTSHWTAGQLTLAWSVLCLVSIVVLSPNLSYPLIEPDETRYAQIALEMNESGDWITPTLDGNAYLDKPPLMYWLTAIAFQCFGNHETAARLPSMFAALGTILLTFGWGGRIVGQRSAWLGSIALALCGGFVLAGRFLILDSLLALLTTACMLSGYIAVRGQGHRWRWWMISGVACALGVLTKGPIALILCAPPLVVSGWLRADQSRTRLLHWAVFVVPMIAVCVPWYIAVAKSNSQFLDYFFWEHNFKRFTQGSNHKQPFWFYIPVVFAAMFPTSLLLPSVAVFLTSRSNRKRSLRSKDLGFLFCGSVWMLFFFSAASCKLPTYVLPTIPLICLLTGVMLDQTVFRSGASDRITTFLRPFPQRAILTLVASCLVMVAADVLIGGRMAISSVFALVGCIGILGLTIVHWNRQIAFTPSAWAATMSVATAVLFYAAAVLLPTISTERSVLVETRRFADSEPAAWIVFFGEKPHGASFHLPTCRTKFFPTSMANEFIGFVAQQSDLILVADDARIEQTRQMLSDTHELLVSANHEHVYQAKRISHPTDRIAGLRGVDR